jgi:hypothetical protein
MTQAVDTQRGRQAVLESSATVTLVNDRGRYLRVKRWAVSLDIERTLVHVWISDSKDGLASAPRRDMFVRERRSTTSDLGFHRLLEEFIGWSLPRVPNYADGETPLYLEILFPLFYIEQKFGWSGVAPRIPTHYGIRDPLRRAVEYVLGLSTLARIRALEALRQEEASITRDWTEVVARASETASAESFRVSMLAMAPTGSSRRRNAILEANDGKRWIPLSSAEGVWRARLRSLSTEVTLAGDRTTQSRGELDNVERDVRRIGASLRGLREELSLSRADLDGVASRLSQVENDRHRLQDILRIRTLGGELELPLVSEGRCPTCQQDLDGRLVESGAVSSVEDNIQLLDAERTTLLSMRAAASDRDINLSRAVSAAEEQLMDARSRVRLIRDELVGPSNAPSLAEVQERLHIENRLLSAERAGAVVASADEKLDELAERLDDVRARRAQLNGDSNDSQDARILGVFRNSFQEQLEAYGLRSLSPDEVTIDDRTLLPVNDGFELSFDVAMGISASDAIRTKWAYHTALLETASTLQQGRHIGFLILDEPRQQETDRRSLAAFLQRLRLDLGLGQVIYATSEESTMLDDLLREIPHTRLRSGGGHLIGPQEAS